MIDEQFDQFRFQVVIDGQSIIKTVEAPSQSLADRMIRDRHPPEASIMPLP